MDNITSILQSNKQNLPSHDRKTLPEDNLFSLLGILSEGLDAFIFSYKYHPETKNIQRTLHTKIKRQWPIIHGKSNISKETTKETKQKSTQIVIS